MLVRNGCDFTVKKARSYVSVAVAKIDFRKSREVRTTVNNWLFHVILRGNLVVSQ
jgi:hypothetical protein